MAEDTVKTVCDCCFAKYPLAKNMCPECGYRGLLHYCPRVSNALPIGRVVGEYRIGMAVDSDSCSVRYIGQAPDQGRRCFIREFFLQGAMEREPGGTVKVCDSADAGKVERALSEFRKQHKADRTWIENGTVYAAEAYRKRDVHFGKNDAACSAAMRSWVGKRENQEDIADYVVSGQFAYAVLCDGMGGLAGGEVASGSCLNKLMELREVLAFCDEAAIAGFLRGQISLADRQIVSYTDGEGKQLRAGTTLLCAVIRDDRLYFASVGDSRIYLLRDRKLEQITAEHNYLAELIKQAGEGRITLEEAYSHPKREALTSYVGIGNVKLIDLPENPIRLLPSDSVLLCSDGLFRALSEEEIVELLSSGKSPDAAAEALIRAVQKKELSHQDNTTVIVIRKNN